MWKDITQGVARDAAWETDGSWGWEIRQRPDHGRPPSLWACCSFCSGCFPVSLPSPSFCLLGTWWLSITILCYCINIYHSCNFSTLACVFSLSPSEYIYAPQGQNTRLLFSVLSIALRTVSACTRTPRKELSNEWINWSRIEG